MGLNRVEVRTDPRNAASRRLLLRLGFHHEGTLRETRYLDGRYTDDLVLGLLCREWQARGGSAYSSSSSRIRAATRSAIVGFPDAPRTSSMGSPAATSPSSITAK